LTEKLSYAAVRKALPPTQGQLFLWDTEIKGFGLRITKAGAKSFVLDYRADGRQRRITLGGYPDWTVQAARAAAKALKRDVDQGHDPMGDRHALREAPTIQDLWERYRLEKLPKKAARSQSDEQSMWEKIILPRLGKLRVADVKFSELDDLHRDITRIRQTPVRANRVIEVLRGAFNLAIRWHWRQDNPAKGIQKNSEEKRERYLSKPEIIGLARALDQHHEVTSANAIKLLMLTGARRGEVLTARWDMFDLENGIWTKPSAHTKQRRIHRVPLNGPAVALLRSMHFEAKSEFAFEGTDGKPLTDIKRTWLSVCKAAGLVRKVEQRNRSGKVMLDDDGNPMLIDEPTVRIHDLRHSFASILVSAGASLPLIGQLLGHTQVQTTHRYAHLFDSPMRDAAEAVGAFVEAPRTTVPKLGHSKRQKKSAGSN
jgi:integrase